MYTAVLVLSYFLRWNQFAGSLAEANSYAYRLFVDQSAGIVLTGVSCYVAVPATPTEPFECQALLPSLSAGPHVITLRAEIGESVSPQSSPVSFTLTPPTAPSTPTNVWIAK